MNTHILHTKTFLLLTFNQCHCLQSFVTMLVIIEIIEIIEITGISASSPAATPASSPSAPQTYQPSLWLVAISQFDVNHFPIWYQPSLSGWLQCNCLLTMCGCCSAPTAKNAKKRTNISERNNFHISPRLACLKWSCAPGWATWQSCGVPALHEDQWLCLVRHPGWGGGWSKAPIPTTF